MNGHLAGNFFLGRGLRQDKKKAEEVKACFEKYSEWSGQEANITKSSILFSKNTTASAKREIKNIMGFP